MTVFDWIIELFLCGVILAAVAFLFTGCGSDFNNGNPYTPNKDSVVVFINGQPQKVTCKPHYNLQHVRVCSNSTTSCLMYSDNSYGCYNKEG